ncbi:kinase-like domain-containing protein [Rhizophagus irregularis DAOM 181602=DAOM 197198]|nr:kinase-like domain-containing protein [Rhizophagus irregularis DAOM 181602=DAOM 197198]
MEPLNTIDENSFDPTPRLKSSPIPIKFISFDIGDKNCIYCGNEYVKTLFCYQHYCKKCLSSYINDITDNNIYLDVYIYTMDLECIEHEISRTKVPQIIQECCINCLRILCFKQIDGYISDYGLDRNNLTIYYNVIESEKYCKLCGKSLYQGTDRKIMMQSKLCSDCYLISSGLIESTLFKKQISILCLPWCSDYSGLDDFLLNNIIYDYLERVEFANSVKIIDKYFVLQNILSSIFKINGSIRTIRWIPFSQFMNVKEIAKGGYGIIYKATWLSKNETVILKRFENSKNIAKYFLNELKALLHCIKNYNGHLIKTYGFTKDPELEDYIIVMRYASEGDLHKYLQKNFTKVKWNKQKPHILWQISKGLEAIHNENFIHRDFHSGNILFDSNDTYKNEIRLAFGRWYFKGENKTEFNQAETIRKKLIESKKIGPEFAEKRHSEAIYTSRPLSALISKCSSTYSSSIISFGNKQDSNYISAELELDIDIESSIQNFSLLKKEKE